MRTHLFTWTIFSFAILIFDNSYSQTWSSGTGGDIYYDGGQVGIGVSAPIANLQVKIGSFSSVQNNYTGDLHIYTETTNGLNNYGGGISFSRLAGSGKRAAIVAKQTGSDEDELGLAFFTHGATYAAPLVESVTITHFGHLKLNTIGAHLKFMNSGNEWVNYLSGANENFFNITRSQTGGAEFRIYSDDNDHTNAYIKIGGTTTISNMGTSTFNQGLNVLNGNVGIGTTTPDGKLHLQGGLAIAHPTINYDTSGDAGERAGIIFGANIAGNSMYWISPDATQGNRLNIGTGAAYNDSNSKLTIVNNGNVGIGTTSPVSKLHVDGDIAINYGSSLKVDTNWGGSGEDKILKTGWQSGRGDYLDLYVPGNGTENQSVKVSITDNGEVGIGTTDTHGYKLAVNGGILAEEVYLEQQTNWPDYVFSSKYNLLSLEETESFIDENSHLPNIPSAIEVEENGYNIGEMNARLLEKIEELTLHLIEQNKEIKSLKAQMKDIQQNSK